MENIGKGYTGRNMHVRIARQPVIMPLDNFQVNSTKSAIQISVRTQITLQHKPNIVIVKMDSLLQTLHNPVARKKRYSKSNTAVNILLLRSFIHVAYHRNNYSRTSIYRFSRGWRKQTMNAGKRLIWETVTHCKKITHRK